MGLAAPVGSSQIRDQISVHWVSRQILNHWTTREVPRYLQWHPERSEQQRRAHYPGHSCERCTVLFIHGYLDDVGRISLSF